MADSQNPQPSSSVQCYHCGDPCVELVREDDKSFCCNGCLQVYQLLNENQLCRYYDFDKNPGLKAKGRFVSDRFAYLDDPAVTTQLADFVGEQLVNIHFHLPQMHCASCIYLLEHLHRINPGILKSQSDFQKKEVFISYNPTQISLRALVELLAFIGYEPAISLQDSKPVKKNRLTRRQLYQLGVAGFAFSNIMMLSFPEYFSGGNIETDGLQETFSWVIFGLSLPVLLYAAGSIFQSAWKGLRQKDINIDVPIALAIIITFARSYYEIITGTGAGYLDSGTGIIFFMLVGRWFQARTYDALSFDRDYHAYFPLGVTVMKEGKEQAMTATQLKKSDIIKVRSGEMIPADACLLEGEALIDYSFVSGEQEPVARKKGDLIYAGGKQTGAAITLEVLKEVSQSYITRLWNNDVFQKDSEKEASFIHPWARYFTLALFTVALSAGIYWSFTDPARVWPVVTAVLIVACPCSLLLSATFTFGNMLRHLGREKMYLKNALVIEQLSGVDTLVFDKTGTITLNDRQQVQYVGTALNAVEKQFVQATAAQSAHSLSRFVASSLQGQTDETTLLVSGYRELPGQGVEALVDETPVRLGAAGFAGSDSSKQPSSQGARVYVRIGEETRGFFDIQQQYREGMEAMARELKTMGFSIHVLSGDNNREEQRLQNLLGKDALLRFDASPQDKLDYIQQLQSAGKKVGMIGDGLNDAGALKQADAGIAISDHAGRFTPASDAILDGGSLWKLPRLIRYARAGKKIIAISFIVSILYNVVGLSFAVQGLLSPLVAAILMPASSISIILLVSVLGGWMAWQQKLHQN